MYQVTKRDGKVVEFEITKIAEAIRKAFEAQNRQYHPSVIDFLALRVTADFESKIKDDMIAVEDIQDSVEHVLAEAGYSDVAKAYSTVDLEKLMVIAYNLKVAASGAEDVPKLPLPGDVPIPYRPNSAVIKKALRASTREFYY